MGKRKSSKKVEVKRGPAPLDKTFRCLFCQHPGVVTCKMDKKERVGRLDCKVCAQSFQMSINHLTQPIDIFTEWLDACEEVNVTSTSRTEAGNTTQQRPKRAGGYGSDSGEEDLDAQQDDGGSDEDGSRRRPPAGRTQQRAQVSDDEELPEA